MFINDYEIKPGANLSEADLSGANLREANLSGANLSEANLRWARLNRITLCNATIDGAILCSKSIGRPGCILCALTDAEWLYIRTERNKNA